MIPFGEEMHIEIAENRWKPIGIIDVELPGRQFEAQSIGDRRVRTDDAGEETSGMHALELRDLRATFVDYPNARCRRLKAADHQANGVDEMRSQQAEWTTMVAADQSFDLR